MIRAAALLLTLLTGFSGLVYEVAWQKYLATLLGSHSEATAAVLALFLGGLSLGYALFGRLSRRLVERGEAAQAKRRLLRVYGAVEASIGLYAFAFPLAFRGAQILSLAAPVESAGLAFAFDVLLSALLIGPPAVLMGGTIPLLTQALARSLDDATRFHALVYGLNTAGAFSGALAAAFWLIPALGLVGVLVAMGTLNVLAGAAFLVLAQRAPRAAAAPLAATREMPSVAGFPAYAAVALLVGFSMMAAQTVLIRLGGLSLGSSHFTFAMVVAVFVLCIALGSLAVSLPSRIPASVLVLNQWLLFVLMTVLYFGLKDAPYWAHVLRSFFRSEPEVFHVYWFAVFLGMLVVIGPAVLFSGAVLPLLFHHLRHQVGDLGAVAGRLYSWNTVGSLLGALLGGYVLFFWIDLHEVYRVALASLAVAAVLLSARVVRGHSPVAWSVVLVGFLAGLALLPAWPVEPFSLGLFRFRVPTPLTHAGPEALYRERHRDAKVLFYEDDATNSIAVVQEAQQALNRSIVNNGKSDGNLVADYTTMALTALVPTMLARRPERAFVVGYGTGVTVGELASLPEVQSVRVAEISRGVLRAARFFELGNQGASANPKVELIRGDAYRVLLRSPGRYDVIASEPSNPWMAGVEMLYSREFLEAARARLNPGGVYAQWFHSYETDVSTLSLIIRTYAAVFEDVAVWYTVGPDLLLIGFAPEGGDPFERLVARASSPAYRAGLTRAGIGDVTALLAHELVPRGVLRGWGEGGEVHTLLHPILSDHAARAFFAGGQAELPSLATLGRARIGARESMLRRHLRAGTGRLSEQDRARVADELCKTRPNECAVFLAHWLHEEPASPGLAARIRGAQRRMRGLRQLSMPFLRRLSRLFDPDAAGHPDPVTPQAAAAEARLFARFYFQPLPFRRHALMRLFERCAQDQGNTLLCLEERAKAELALGDLGQEVDEPAVAPPRVDS